MSNEREPRSLPQARKLSAQRRKAKRHLTVVESRRGFLALGATMVASGALLFRGIGRASPAVLESDGVPVRPPTAGSDDDRFQSRCIRCGLCGTVCENGCIRFFGLDEAAHGALTPYLDVRRRSCTLCMRCTDICPTDALTPVEDNLAAIAEHIDMGKAVVERDLCFSYLGRVCGYCHDACPLPQKAIKLTPPALPVVQDGCVGCGRCVEMCPQSPTAISIIPAAELARRRAEA